MGRLGAVQLNDLKDDYIKPSQDVTRKFEEINVHHKCFTESQSTIIKELSTDRKNVIYRFEELKSSLHTFEMSCLELKHYLVKGSEGNKENVTRFRQWENRYLKQPKKYKK